MRASKPHSATSQSIPITQNQASNGVWPQPWNLPLGLVLERGSRSVELISRRAC